MNLHPEPVENLDAKTIIPWEPLGQIEPKSLPAPSEKYPGPWKYDSRGNGHFDVIDAQGRAFAHVYCWDGAEYDALGEAIIASGGKW